MSRAGAGAASSAGAASTAGADTTAPAATTGAGTGGGNGTAADPVDLGSTAGKPCRFCSGSHSESVHTVTDTLGEGPQQTATAVSSSAKGPPSSAIFAYIDDLAAAGHRLFGHGQGLSDKIKPALDRIAAIEANNPASDDKTGQQFHQGYDRVPGKPGSTGTVPASVDLRESIEVIGDAYAAKGILAQKVAKAYADADDANAASASKYIGIWGA